MALFRTTPLRLAPLVRLSLRPGGVEVEHGDRRVRGGPELLEIVRAFQRPTRCDEAVASITKTMAPHEWAMVTALVVELCEAGVLVDTGGVVLAPRPVGFDAAAVHVSMLDDRVRTEAFIAALRDAVRPDDVVVDLGTGTGVLALAAAQAGARHVYAIEQGAIADAAAEVFARDPRITLVRGRSTEVTLPERATLLVSEIIDDEPLGERVLEYFADARARLLAEGARQLPVRLRVYARGVELDEATRRRHRFDADQAARWSSWYALNLAPLAGAEIGEGYRFFATQAQASVFTPGPAAVELASVDLAAGPTVLDEVRHADVITSGGIDALVGWFELDIDGTRTLTSEPGRAAPSCHWRCSVWLLPRGLAARSGEPFPIRYRHNVTGTRLSAG